MEKARKVRHYQHAKKYMPSENQKWKKQGKAGLRLLAIIGTTCPSEIPGLTKRQFRIFKSVTSHFIQTPFLFVICNNFTTLQPHTLIFSHFARIFQFELYWKTYGIRVVPELEIMIVIHPSTTKL